MANFYIAEGPDGAGKTTLIEQLTAAHPGCHVQHFGKPESAEEAENYWKTYLRFIKRYEEKETVIFDRCWYSDMVYGPVMRNTQEMTNEKMEILELAVKACGGGIIIYCTGKLEVLWKRCMYRGENYITNKDMLKAICAKYDEVMNLPKYIPVVRYDTTVKW